MQWTELVNKVLTNTRWREVAVPVCEYFIN